VTCFTFHSTTQSKTFFHFHFNDSYLRSFISQQFFRKFQFIHNQPIVRRGLTSKFKDVAIKNIHTNKNVKPILLLASLIRRPGNCPHCRNEQPRTSRRYEYITPYTLVVPTVQLHHRLTSIMRAVIYNIPNVILRCFVLDNGLKVFPGLQSVKTKA